MSEPTRVSVFACLVSAPVLAESRLVCIRLATLSQHFVAFLVAQSVPQFRIDLHRYVHRVYIHIREIVLSYRRRVKCSLDHFSVMADTHHVDSGIEAVVRRVIEQGGVHEARCTHGPV